MVWYAALQVEETDGSRVLRECLVDGLAWPEHTVHSDGTESITIGPTASRTRLVPVSSASYTWTGPVFLFCTHTFFSINPSSTN
jgi:hypothetical protein